MSDQGERARELFGQGYNCAQAVFLCYNDALNMEEKDAARLTNCLGGGFSQTGGLCGAVSAGCLVLSGLYGREEPSREGEQAERQKVTYGLVRELQAEFQKEFGDLSCPALLKKGLADSGDARDSKYLCPLYVQRAAEMVEQLRERQDQEGEAAL